jgi:hypothetical protein
MLTWLVLIGAAWLVRWRLGGPLIVVYGEPAAPDPRER